MIRVTHVIVGIGFGGAEAALVKLTSRVNPGFAHDVVTLSSDLSQAPRLRAIGIDVTSLDARPSLAGFPHLVARLRSVLRRTSPDVVQTWMYHADLVGGLAAFMEGVPVIWNVQSGVLDPTGIRSRTRLTARLCATLSRIVPAAIVSCSRAGADIHTAMGYARAKFTIIPNGADPTVFYPDPRARTEVRRELGLGDGPVVGMIARLHPQKDHSTFIAAAKALAAIHTDAKFLLVGPGVDERGGWLEAQLRESGLAERTIRIGVRMDVARVMNALDIHLLSSAYGEGFPNVLAEAMACGVPCVVTDVGDSRFIVDGVGRSVAPGDADGLAAACAELLALSPQAMCQLRELARKRIEQRFSLSASIADYESLYTQIAHARGSVAHSSGVETHSR